MLNRVPRALTSLMVTGPTLHNSRKAFILNILKRGSTAQLYSILSTIPKVYLIIIIKLKIDRRTALFSRILIKS